MPTKSAQKSAEKTPSLISDSKLKQLYAAMLKCRILDSHVRNRGDKFSWKGKEAAAVGAAIDLRSNDAIVFPLNAAIGHFLKGIPLRSIFYQLHKHSSRNVKAHGTTTAGAQSALATGIAYALNIGTKDHVTVAFLSESPEVCESGHNALLLAERRKLPIIYVYTGTPIDVMQMRSYGFPVIPVDGNDVVAVYRVAHECTMRARAGGGPSVIICSTSTDKNAATGQDPLRNMETYLSAKGLFTKKEKDRMISAFKKELITAKVAAGKPSRTPETQKHSQYVFKM